MNQSCIEDFSRHDAIVQAGRDRLRPILMTTGPTCLVCCRFASATPVGQHTNWRRRAAVLPHGRAIVGGLFFSTFITLLVLPTIYVLLDELRSWARGIVRRAKFAIG
ncbi:MAG: efflux RND transporter permease subunit [candidate division KSB1 bacterium]|nr:efflux RND transporter permease subunit [candidate division KSB1 bacterium]MDZ7309792.1 efflux RND transporter permease subunit [candidate division KSB1 bacterium]